MKRPLWAFTILLILLFSGCSNTKGDSLVFFYDKEFGQVAEFAPDFLGGKDNPLFKGLSDFAGEAGYALKPAAVDLLEENYIEAFKQKLPQPGNKLVITSFLYSVPELQELLDSYLVAVVGAAIDVPQDKLKIIGNGFSMITDEGRMLGILGKKINFIALKSGFQQRITDAFKEGAGDRVTLFEADINAKNIIVPYSDDMVVASYGPYFKSFASPQARNGAIRVLNYPSSPGYVDPYMKKRVEAYLCYDFTGSFKSAVLELANGKGERKSFYSFDLIRR